ncbi:MAG: flagellar protein FliS [Lachnospiraceae bacterium]|nr:flagellar protein FliS [Lachnospiraceae bacterium]
MTSGEIKDYTLRISQANASALAVIIVELALDSIESAKKAILAGENDSFILHSKKSERYVGELIHSLNMEDPNAKPMAGYLITAHRNIIDSRIRLDESLIVKAEAVIKAVKPTFDRIAKEDKDPAIMNNVEQVYAGLTYGKAGLNELSMGVSSNRGFKV